MAMTDKKKKLMVTAIAGAMAATVAVGGGTFAFLQGQTEEVKNEFKPEQVTVEISETPHDPYDIIPGTEEGKDPKLTITNTLESFLYVKVTDNTYGLVNYTMADGWNKLDGYEDVYYKKIAPVFDEEGNAVAQDFFILKDNKVSYDKELVNEDMLDEEGNLLTDVALSFEGFAIQARPFLGDYTNDESKAAVYAYTQTEPIKVSNSSQLTEALRTVEDGGVIELTEGSDISRITVNNGKTFKIDLGDNTVEQVTVKKGDVTVDNGKISNPGGQGLMINPISEDSVHVTIGKDAEVSGRWAVTVFNVDNTDSASSTVDVYGKTQGNIFVSGNLHSGNTVVNVYDGAVVEGGNDKGNIGIAGNGWSTINIMSGATVTGYTGVEVRAGVLNVEDGATIIGTGVPTDFTPNNNGTTTEGAGIGVSQHTTYLPINVNISGGTITAYTPLYQINSQDSTDEDLAKININVTGGTFENNNGGTTLFSIANRDKITYSNIYDTGE